MKQRTMNFMINRPAEVIFDSTLLPTVVLNYGLKKKQKIMVSKKKSHVDFAIVLVTDSGQFKTSSKPAKRKDWSSSDRLRLIKELKSKIRQKLVAKLNTLQLKVSQRTNKEKKLLESHRNNIHPSRKRVRERCSYISGDYNALFPVVSPQTFPTTVPDRNKPFFLEIT